MDIRRRPGRPTGSAGKMRSENRPDRPSNSSSRLIGLPEETQHGTRSASIISRVPGNHFHRFALPLALSQLTTLLFP